MSRSRRTGCLTIVALFLAIMFLVRLDDRLATIENRLGSLEQVEAAQ